MILLTGASGFLGQAVYKSLVENNLDVKLVLRSKPLTKIKNPIVYTTDIFAESEDWWVEVLHDVDTIIHVAWHMEPGEGLTSEKNIESLEGTLKLARASTKAGVKRFVGIGTCFEYDLAQEELSVDTALKPSSLYSACKVSAFLTLTEWFKNHGCTSFAWCRPFYLYGDNENSNRLVPYIHERLSNGEFAELSSGVQIRDYLDVNTAAKLITDITQSERSGPFNVCSEVGITVRNLAEGIADQYGRRDLLKFGIRADNYTDPLKVIGKSNI